MISSSSSIITKLLTTHQKCTLIITGHHVRHKKYYRHWEIPFHLDDFQTITLSKPNAYERWNQEWTNSCLPNELQYFDTARLPIHLKARMQPATEFFKISSRKEKTEDYRRRLFGEYGLQTGVNPGCLFMDQNELAYEQNKENLRESPVIEVVNAKKEQEEKARQDNEALMLRIRKNLSKMPEMLEKFRNQQAKHLSVDLVKQDKMKMIMEEARDRFGYYPTKHDPKFVKLLQKYEEKNKMERKEKKKR
ncbi:unnamed protein product [Schistosoma turkestanicum]|nr:unnamed protein product [Schistosoma turkestanicum]